jgi:hypothetical protein
LSPGFSSSRISPILPHLPFLPPAMSQHLTYLVMSLPSKLLSHHLSLDGATLFPLSACLRPHGTEWELLAQNMKYFQQCSQPCPFTTESAPSSQRLTPQFMLSVLYHPLSQQPQCSCQSWKDYSHHHTNTVYSYCSKSYSVLGPGMVVHTYNTSQDKRSRVPGQPG